MQFYISMRGVRVVCKLVVLLMYAPLFVLQRLMERSRRLAAMLACHGAKATEAHETDDEEDEDEEGEEEQQSEEEEQEHSEEVEQEQSEEEAEEQDTSWEEIPLSQLKDAPQPSQPSQPPVRNRKQKKLFSPVGQIVRKLAAKRGRKK